MVPISFTRGTFFYATTVWIGIGFLLHLAVITTMPPGRPLFAHAFASGGSGVRQYHNKARALQASDKIYDVVIVGGGSAGLTAAKLSGGTLRKSTLLIEQAKLGGDCTWKGCVPSKSLLASAKASQLLRQQTISGKGSFNSWKDIQQRFRDIQQEIYDQDDSAEALAKFQVDTLVGQAKMETPNSLRVTTPGNNDNKKEVVVGAREGIILCTGAKPKRPDTIAGLDTVDYVTYEEIWDLKDLPNSMTIVGGGPIGCELAQAFARLGTKVTIVANRLLPNEEPEVSELLKQVFEKEGITIVPGRLASVEATKGSGSSSAAHSLTTDGGDTVSGDLLLLSVGRVPNTDGLGLEEVGIELYESSGNGGIAVNDQLRTTCKGVYAAGDCIGDRQFTHYAGFQGAIAARNILLPLTDPGRLSEIPATTFTSPEVASIGLTEAQARAEFGDDGVAVSSMKLDEIDRAQCEGERIGILKVVYRKKNGKILGATMMCPHGGELISEICVAKAAGMPFANLAKVIHPYPTYAIALQMMAADVYYENTMKLKPVYDFLKRIGL